MEAFSCDSCFQEQRSLNDIFQQAIADAKKLANEQGKTIAVIQEGQTYRIQAFAGQPPGATRAIIEPGK